MLMLGRVLRIHRLQLRPSGRPPAFAMLANPVEQGPFEADVIAQPLRLQPFVPQNLLPLGQEFLVEARLFDEVAGSFDFFHGCTDHDAEAALTRETPPWLSTLTIAYLE